MKRLGKKISKDGVTLWRNNGGIIERRAIYANQKGYEIVGGNAPRTPVELKDLCKKGGYKYQSPYQRKK